MRRSAISSRRYEYCATWGDSATRSRWSSFRSRLKTVAALVAKRRIGGRNDAAAMNVREGAVNVSLSINTINLTSY